MLCRSMNLYHGYLDIELDVTRKRCLAIWYVIDEYGEIHCRQNTNGVTIK